jgi:hypothetical protein
VTRPVVAERRLRRLLGARRLLDHEPHLLDQHAADDDVVALETERARRLEARRTLRRRLPDPGRRPAAEELHLLDQPPRHTAVAPVEPARERFAVEQLLVDRARDQRRLVGGRDGSPVCACSPRGAGGPGRP